MDPFDGLPKGMMKSQVAEFVGTRLATAGFPVIERNDGKPWGIEFKIDPKHAYRFLEVFFDGAALPTSVTEHPFGPKILVIEGVCRLSWHVHERKDAFLRVLCGEIDVYTSPTDEETRPRIGRERDVVHIPERIRHRLGGRGDWAIVAEISRNVFPDDPSDDDDERRISDDFGRA